MRKSILALAAVAAAASFMTAHTVEARGLRVGFAFGGGVGGPSNLADPTILERARRQQEKNARGRYVPSPSYQQGPSAKAVAAARNSERRRQAAAASAAAAEKREAAAQARAAKLAAELAARRQAAAKRNQQPEVVKAPVSDPAPQTASASDRALEAAQQEQRAKAEELLRKLNGNPVTTTAKPAVAEPALQPAVAAPSTPPARRVAAPEIVPEKTTPARVVVAPATQRTQAAPAAPAAATGECSRFIPGAGVTVRVPCNE